MNVLVVAPEYPPNVIGGGGAVYARIAEHLASRGQAVTVVFGDFSNGNAGRIGVSNGESRGVSLVPVPLLAAPERLAWMLSATPPKPIAAARLWSRLGSEKWDVAHLHGVGFPLVDLCALALRRRRVPYLLTIHGIPTSPFKRGRIARTAARAYLGVASRRTLDGAAEVSAVSSALLEDENFPVGRGRVIPNGVDLAVRFPPLGVASGSRTKALRLLSASRLSMNKGIDIVIRAVALLGQTHPVHYDIYGSDGGDARALRSLVASLHADDNIRFCGTFPAEARPDIFARYDALLMPSRVEGFGLAALEALGAGLLVIAHPVDGLARFLTDENAVLVRSESPESWRAALEKLAEAGADAMGSKLKAAMATAREFSWDNVLPLYEQELIRLASPKRLASVGTVPS